jgi:hypothetical protein
MTQKTERMQLFRGAISSISRQTGVNIHTVRLWLRLGEPEKSKLPLEKQIELRESINIHRIITEEKHNAKRTAANN